MSIGLKKAEQFLYVLGAFCWAEISCHYVLLTLRQKKRQRIDEVANLQYCRFIFALCRRVVQLDTGTVNDILN